MATERSGAIFAICLTLLLWSTSSLAQLQATVDGQAPPNPVTFGDSISYTITITNADPANGAIGNGVQIFVDGVLQPASAGDWQVTSAIGQTPSCSVDSAFPSAWACFNLDSNLSSFTHEFTWLQPEA